MTHNKEKFHISAFRMDTGDNQDTTQKIVCQYLAPVWRNIWQKFYRLTLWIDNNNARFT